MSLRLAIAAVVMILACSACGQKGALYYPDDHPDDDSKAQKKEAN